MHHDLGILRLQTAVQRADLVLDFGVGQVFPIHDQNADEDERQKVENDEDATCEPDLRLLCRFNHLFGRQAIVHNYGAGCDLELESALEHESEQSVVKHFLFEILVEFHQNWYAVCQRSQDQEQGKQRDNEQAYHEEHANPVDQSVLAEPVDSSLLRNRCILLAFN